MLAGALIGGGLGGAIGLRATLVVGVAVVLVSALCLLLSPVRRLIEAPAHPSAAEGPEVA